MLLFALTLRVQMELQNEYNFFSFNQYTFEVENQPKQPDRKICKNFKS